MARTIGWWASCSLWKLTVNLPACRVRTQGKDSAPSPLPAPSAHTPRACCTAASPVLPAVLGVAVLVLNGDAVNGNGRTVSEPGFYTVGVHVVAAGKQFVHNRILQDLIFDERSLKSMPSSRCWIGRFHLFQSKCTVSARILHGHTGCTGGFSLQNPTTDAQITLLKIAVHRIKMAI